MDKIVLWVKALLSKGDVFATELLTTETYAHRVLNIDGGKDTSLYLSSSKSERL